MMNYVPFIVAALLLSGGMGAAGVSLFVYVDEGDDARETTELAVEIVEDYGPNWVVHPPYSMQFQSQVTGAQGDVAYSWTTSGGTILSGDPAPVIEIGENFPGGMATIILTVWDEEENTDSDSITFEIGAPSSMIEQISASTGNEFPQNNGSAPAMGSAGNPGIFAFPRIDGPPPVNVSFTLTGHPYYVTSYYWEYGDGSHAWTGSSTAHIYETSGNFSVSVFILDHSAPDDRTLLTTTELIILDEEPGSDPTYVRDIPQFPDRSDVIDIDIFAEPVQGNAPLYVNFQISIAPMGQNNIMWDFGDGSAPAWNANPSHIFTEPGMYNVKVTNTIPGCCRGYGEKVIVVEDPMTDQLGVEISIEQIGSAQTFLFEAVPTQEADLTYDWTFSFDAHITGREVLHTFSGYGMRSASVHAYSTELGLFANASVSFFIAEEGAPNVHFLVHSNAQDPARKDFEPLIGAGDPPYIYSWLFGDGYQSSEPEPYHYYYEEGFYRVELYVIDSDQQVGYYSEWIYVTSVIRIEH